MTGLIRLGAIPTIAPFVLPALVRSSRERYPDLKIALREDQTVRLLEQVRDGRLDFALIALPWAVEGLLCRPLFDEELWLIASPGDPVSRLARPTIETLDAQRLLLLEEGHCLRQHALTGCGLSERANPGGIEASSVTTLVQMVEEGLGYALLPEMAIRAGTLKGSTVIARPIAHPAPQRAVALVARNSTARRAEFDALAEISASLVRQPGRPRRSRATPTPRPASAHSENQSPLQTSKG
jgi:LysR family hydrogen peroxide-inducible transcriptional activator